MLLIQLFRHGYLPRLPYASSVLRLVLHLFSITEQYTECLANKTFSEAEMGCLYAAT